MGALEQPLAMGIQGAIAQDLGRAQAPVRLTRTGEAAPACRGHTISQGGARLGRIAVARRSPEHLGGHRRDLELQIDAIKQRGRQAFAKEPAPTLVRAET